MVMKVINKIFFIIILLFTFNSLAIDSTKPITKARQPFDYYRAHGDIMGQVCSFGIFNCRMERLDVVINEEEGQRYYPIRRRYSHLEIEDLKDGVCWIKYSLKGFIAEYRYDYYMKGFGQKKANGYYDVIKPQYVWFKCSLEK